MASETYRTSTIRFTNHPHGADRLPNGNTIVADSGTWLATSRVIEIDPDYPGEPNKIVWMYQQKNDCVVQGEGNLQCPGLLWCRDADVECADPACDTGLVVITGVHQTIGVVRDLNEPPPDGESIPRGTIIPYQVGHGAGFCYDTDKIPVWNGSDNRGHGFFLVTNHGPAPFQSVRVVRTNVRHDLQGLMWQYPSPPCPDDDGDGYGNPGFPSCGHLETDCDDDPSDDPEICETCTCGDADCAPCARCRNPGVSEEPSGDPICSDDVDNDCDGLKDAEDDGCQS